MNIKNPEGLRHRAASSAFAFEGVRQVVDLFLWAARGAAASLQRKPSGFGSGSVAVAGPTLPPTAAGRMGHPHGPIVVFSPEYPASGCCVTVCLRWAAASCWKCVERRRRSRSREADGVPRDSDGGGCVVRGRSNGSVRGERSRGRTGPRLLRRSRGGGGRDWDRVRSRKTCREVRGTSRCVRRRSRRCRSEASGFLRNGKSPRSAGFSLNFTLYIQNIGFGCVSGQECWRGTGVE